MSVNPTTGKLEFDDPDAECTAVAFLFHGFYMCFSLGKPMEKESDRSALSEPLLLHTNFTITGVPFILKPFRNSNSKDFPI